MRKGRVIMTHSVTILACMIGLLATTAWAAQARNKHYPSNREPLVQEKFVPLPLGAVRPEGWLKAQLTIQANGLTGHLDEFWPSLAKNMWKGDKEGEAWERGPYYLDGLVPLAYLLNDQRLLAKVKGWMEPILASGRPDGWFGPEKNKDRWPLAVALKVLTQYYEATGDERVITLLTNYFKYLKSAPPDWPDKEWRGVRAMENVVSAYWLYNRTGDPGILEVADSIYKNSFDWTGYFLNFPYTDEAMAKGIKHGHPDHVVNIAMAVKHPGMRYLQTGDRKLVDAVEQGLRSLDKYHGQAAGRFSGDEHLSGRRPTQGTELCAVVEFMFSLENLVMALGDTKYADRLELLAYNANPGTCTPDYWAHQYDQQANQVLVSIAKRQWSTNNDTSNLYGLEPNYGCCTANMHQGWPKLVTHMWMATHDQGLAAIAYGPSLVKAKVADGAEVTIREVTDYPFDGAIQLRIETAQPVKFPLLLRIPGWADGAKVKVGGEQIPAQAGTFVVLERAWRLGDTVDLSLPMNLRTETRYNNSVSILRGPLYFCLKIGEHYAELKRHHETFPVIDWAIEPTTPWNYGLLIDREHPEKSITVEKLKVGKVPFDQQGAPVVLKVKGRAIPEWVMVQNSAGDPPVSPAVSDRPLVDLELIPYGNTRLRITEFPVLKD
jgi:uncharacterized protein